MTQKSIEKCYIYYGNHAEGLKAISDLAGIIVESLKDSAIFESIEFSNKIVVNSTNIIIEESSRKRICERLIKFKKKYPKTRYYFIITEIPINNSFNNFDNLSSIYYEVDKAKFIDYKFICIKYILKYKITFIILYLYKIYKYINISIIGKLLQKKFGTIKYSKIITIFFIKIIIKIIRKNKNSTLLERDYFYIRYHNTKILMNSQIFEKTFIINNSSKNITDKKFYCDSIEFPYKIIIGPINKKSNLMIFSGTFTNHRKKIIDDLKNKSVSIVTNFKLDDSIRDKYSSITLFSLHIARYESNQEYSSPTRTLQALKNGMLPISYTKCLESNMEKVLCISSLEDLIANLNNSDINKGLSDYYNKKINDIHTEVENYNNNSFKLIYECFGYK